MELQRGMRDKLEKYIDVNRSIEVEMQISGASVYDFCCFGVDVNDKLSDDRYMVFYNQTSSPANEISYRGGNGSAVFTIELNRIPMTIQKLVFTVSIDGSGVMRNINSHVITLKQNGMPALRLALNGSDFQQERAIISIEIYMKDVWRINAVARGFNGGLGNLLRAYGGEEAAPANPTPPPRPAAPPPRPVVPPPRPAAPPPRPATPPPTPTPVAQPPPAKINLVKGQKVNLVKGSAGLGEVLINLNWKQPKGIFARPIDLDLGCLYELKNGDAGSIQALGNTFGSLTQPPFIALDGDDRSGSSVNGENLRINGQMVQYIKRILIYTYIYEGAANWKQADGVVTVKCPGSPEIIVRMDEYGSNLPLCAIAYLENVNNTLSVEKIVRFFRGQRYADQAFGWGLNWTHGTKD